MEKKEEQRTFEVRYMDSKNKIGKATVECWFETRENPEVCDLVYGKQYKFEGRFRIFVLEFTDEKGAVVGNESDRLSNTFYGLRKKLEGEGIKLLIKGCNVDYWMIPRLQYSMKAIKLTLGKRTSTDDPTAGIFEPEEELNKIATVDEQLKYYDKWLESIKGLPW